MNDFNSTEIQRLLTYLQQQAIDSHHIPVTPEELITLVGCLIDRLILQSPLLDETVQEELDNLRYTVYPNKVTLTGHV